MPEQADRDCRPTPPSKAPTPTAMAESSPASHPQNTLAQFTSHCPYCGEPMTGTHTEVMFRGTRIIGCPAHSHWGLTAIRLPKTLGIP